MNNVITTCRAAFHGLNVTIDDIMADGDKVTARFTARGVHEGEFMGLPPTGKPIAMTGIEIFRVKEGKITELWGEANLMGLMQQTRYFTGPRIIGQRKQKENTTGSFHGKEELKEWTFTANCIRRAYLI